MSKKIKFFTNDAGEVVFDSDVKRGDPYIIDKKSLQLARRKSKKIITERVGNNLAAHAERRAAILDDYLTGEYTYKEIGLKYGIGAGRAGQIIGREKFRRKRRNSYDGPKGGPLDPTLNITGLARNKLVHNGLRDPKVICSMSTDEIMRTVRAGRATMQEIRRLFPFNPPPATS